MATVMDDGCSGVQQQQQQIMQNGGATIHHHPVGSSSSSSVTVNTTKMTMTNNNNNNNQQHHIGMQSNHQTPFLCSGCATPIVDQYLLKVIDQMNELDLMNYSYKN